ncbi:hypothetical protein, partial [uncultured Dialister sp.]|uniref:hypothetical protein n=1 Tax=uncultured Dialister sp. TaxID=278064 RepID=UPI0025D054CC
HAFAPLTTSSVWGWLSPVPSRWRLIHWTNSCNLRTLGLVGVFFIFMTSCELEAFAGSENYSFICHPARKAFPEA